MIRRPPRSTPFPSTTLFRSSENRWVMPSFLARIAGIGLAEGESDLDVHAGGQVVEPLQDRKSTRLNSSHAHISYAVFCLKKKKPTTPHLRQSRLSLQHTVHR